MLSLATRIWEEIKHDEKDPRTKGKPWNENKAPSKTTHPKTTAQPNPSKDTNRPSNTENKGEKRTENRTWRPRGPREFASGRNEKGERICFTCGSTEHTSWYHKKENKVDENTEGKKPSVHVVKTTTSRKKGQERMAEKAWDSLTDSSDSGNE